MISLVKVRELDVDDDYSLRGPTLQKAIEVCHGRYVQWDMPQNITKYVRGFFELQVTQVAHRNPIQKAEGNSFNYRMFVNFITLLGWKLQILQSK